MVRIRRPWAANIGKRQVNSPNIYIGDSGILHNFLYVVSVDDRVRHPKIGASWEGFLLEVVIHQIGTSADECYFWATHTGAELDLLVSRGGRRDGFVFKRTTAPGHHQLRLGQFSAGTERLRHRGATDPHRPEPEAGRAGRHWWQPGHWLHATAMERVVERQMARAAPSRPARHRHAGRAGCVHHEDRPHDTAPTTSAPASAEASAPAESSGHAERLRVDLALRQPLRSHRGPHDRLLQQGRTTRPGPNCRLGWSNAVAAGDLLPRPGADTIRAGSCGPGAGCQGQITGPASGAVAWPLAEQAPARLE